MSALSNQVALITGGASGIGLAVVQRFVAEGCRVGVVDINAEGLASLSGLAGDRVIGIEADVSTIEGNETAVRTTVQAFGHLDVFVGNAGLFDGFAEFADLPIRTVLDCYHQIFDLNVRGLLLGAIVAGTHPGRPSEAAITLCDLTGTGAQDTAIASYAFASARKLGIGTKINA